MAIQVTLTPAGGGGTINVRNVIRFSWGVDRPPSPNGYLGMQGHHIDQLRITRLNSLNIDGAVALDLEPINLSAAQGDQAYFDGEIKITRPDNPEQPVLVQRFRGHITGTQQDADSEEITETLVISVTKLEVGDATFLHSIPA